MHPLPQRPVSSIQTRTTWGQTFKGDKSSPVISIHDPFFRNGNRRNVCSPLHSTAPCSHTHRRVSPWRQICFLFACVCLWHGCSDM